MTTTFCTESDLQRLLSTYGVDAFADHDQDGDADDLVVTDCISQASEEVMMWLHDRYSETDLATSNLVTRWTTLFAAYQLCMRRGNTVPESIQNEYERISDLLVKISNGIVNVPNIPLRCDMRPTWSNLRVDRRWPRSKTRVKRVNSSDAPTSLTQDNDDDVPIYDR